MAQAATVSNQENQGSSLPAQPSKPAGWLTGFFGRLAAYPRRLREYLHEVRVELRQVTWPTRADIRATTIVVIVTVAFFGLYFFLIDRGLAEVVEWVFNKFRP